MFYYFRARIVSLHRAFFHYRRSVVVVVFCFSIILSSYRIFFFPRSDHQHKMHASPLLLVRNNIQRTKKKYSFCSSYTYFGAHLSQRQYDFMWIKYINMVSIKGRKRKKIKFQRGMITDWRRREARKYVAQEIRFRMNRFEITSFPYCLLFSEKSENNMKNNNERQNWRKFTVN